MNPTARGIELPAAHTGPLAKRPAVSVAALLVAGILLHDAPSAWATLPIATAAVVAAHLARAFRFVAASAVAVAIVAGGAGLARWEHYRFAGDDIGLFATDEARLATVRGRVTDAPQIVAGPAGGRPLPPRQLFLLDVAGVLTTGGWADATGRVPVRIAQPNPALAAGQMVELIGQIERPHPAANPGEFDWAVYYRRLRITATFAVAHPDGARVLAEPRLAPLLWARSRVRHALAAGFDGDHSADHAILQAALLGDRDPQLRDVTADFDQTGVAYQLSASGLHIALLAAGVVVACRRLRLRPRPALAVGLAFTLCVAAVITPSHSGVRSVLIAMTFAVGLFARRTTTRSQLVGLATVAVLVVHPLDLYTDGFQLSLAVVVAFLLLLPAVRRWFADPDRAPRPGLTPLGHGLKWVAVTAQYACVAWLATAPLTAAHFGRVTPWVVVADVAVYPCVALALYAGAAKVVLTLLWPPLAHPLAVAAGWPVLLMRAIVHAAAQLPGGSVTIAAPPTWAVVAYYAVLLVPLVPVPTSRWRWPLRLSPAAGLAGLLLVSLGSAPPAAAGSTAGPALTFTLLSIGAGQTAVAVLPTGHGVVFDAGSSTVPDVADRVAIPYLRARGLSRLDDVFLSHGDFDHISAAGQLAAAFSPAAVFTSHHFRGHAAGNQPDLDLLADLDALGLPPHPLAAGDHLDLGGGATVDVLWPPAGGAWSSNDAGLVLRLTYAGRRILLPADVQDPAFAGLLAHRDQLSADVLVAPHHGSVETLTPAFLAAVHPATIIASNAAHLSSKQRRFDHLAGPTPLYRTPTCGAITVTITADGRVAVSTFLHRTAAGADR